MASDLNVSEAAARSQAGFTVFTAAWAVFTLMHQGLIYGLWLRFDDPAKFCFNALPAIAAIVALGRPGSIARFVFLMASVVALKVYDMPYLGNHLFFALCAALSMLLCVGYRFVFRDKDAAGNRKPLNASAFDLFAPVVRLEIIALYFWVVIHKLNWDYLNPEVSCGWELYVGMDAFMQGHVGLPLPMWGWLPWAGLIGALIIEAVIPLLLIFRKTRKAGLVVGLLFHLMLSFHANVFIASFSMMLYAIYVLFLPGTAWVGIVAAWQRWRVGRWLAGGGWRMSGVVTSAIVAYCGVIVALSAIDGGLGRKQVIDTLHHYSAQVVFLAWLAYALVVLAVFARWCRSKWTAADKRWGRVAMPLFYLLPLFIFLNGFSPYVGLKTHHAFAMFSNLRTEDGETNHVFIPVSVRLVPYQDEPVLILASDVNEKTLKNLSPSQDGSRVTWFEFRREINRIKPDQSVTYQREGEAPVTVKGSDVAKRPELAPPPYWVRKTQLYKAVPSAEKSCPCRH